MQTIKNIEKMVDNFEVREQKATLGYNTITQGRLDQLEKEYDNVKNQILDAFAISQSHAANARLETAWNRIERSGRRIGNLTVEY